MNPQIFYIVLGAAAFIIILLAVILIALISNRSHSPLSEIQQKLGSLEAAANQMQEIGREVGSLKSVLHAPKLRGNFGEYLLYNLLKDTLPPKNFAVQHQFSDGSAVDAIIRLGKNIIPVDSKFPLESFERYLASSDSESKKKAKAEFTRSVKGRIDEISKKYIRPQEGTFDFALMYIPSEGVYYEILTNDTQKGYELFDYAMKSRVIPVSPNTFYAYLMSIVYGLKGMKIEEQAESIIKKISGIQKSFADLTEEITTLGKHLSNASAKFSEVKEKSEKIERQISNISEN
ncbi:MAG: DNA recombination protein RmuC [Treponema sp.]|uniref:DNA recombination protein RmuC n=1 Tax=Treponema sp. TaxID=166 RepID=UPI0025D3F8D7|nr:DNA recombination protein RmuC [Treponema sp.]MBR0494559.1 DNA recombination protein RmuC [Treponema sp.]